MVDVTELRKAQIRTSSRLLKRPMNGGDLHHDRERDSGTEKNRQKEEGRV